MAVDTQRRLAANQYPSHLMNGRRVAVNARTLRHAPISRLDLDWIVEVLKRERQRVIKPIISLGPPMPDKVMRQMTVVACSNVPVRGVLPRIVMPLHDMAIRTILWIAAQIAGAFPISKREHPDAKHQTKKHG